MTEFWWAYCSNKDHDYWEGQFSTQVAATKHAVETGLEEFWTARCAEDPDGPDEDSVRLLSVPQRHTVSPTPARTRCTATAPDPSRAQCGLDAGHDGQHSILIETGAPWFPESPPTAKGGG